MSKEAEELRLMVRRLEDLERVACGVLQDMVVVRRRSINDILSKQESEPSASVVESFRRVVDFLDYRVKSGIRFGEPIKVAGCVSFEDLHRREKELGVEGKVCSSTIVSNGEIREGFTDLGHAFFRLVLQHELDYIRNNGEQSIKGYLIVDLPDDGRFEIACNEKTIEWILKRLGPARKSKSGKSAYYKAAGLLADSLDELDNDVYVYSFKSSGKLVSFFG